MTLILGTYGPWVYFRTILVDRRWPQEFFLDLQLTGPIYDLLINIWSVHGLRRSNENFVKSYYVWDSPTRPTYGLCIGQWAVLVNCIKIVKPWYFKNIGLANHDPIYCLWSNLPTTGGSVCDGTRVSGKTNISSVGI